MTVFDIERKAYFVKRPPSSLLSMSFGNLNQSREKFIQDEVELIDP